MSTVEVATEGAVCTVTLNRPERLNALNTTVIADLDAAVEQIAKDPQVQIMVMQGAGRAFSVGADLETFEDAENADSVKTLSAGSVLDVRYLVGGFQRLVDKIESMPQVTIAKIRGGAIGGGFLLALAFDLRVGAEDVVMFLPELAVGLPLPAGGIPRLALEIGMARARDLVMTGREIHAQEAYEWGLLNRLVPVDELDDATDELVARLQKMSMRPLLMARAAFRALGRLTGGIDLAWADSDLLLNAATDPELTATALEYRKRRLGH